MVIVQLSKSIASHFKRGNGAVENNQAYTLYFIDIKDQQGKPTGLDLSVKIRQKSNTDIIIFITHYLIEIIYSTEHKILAFNIITKYNKTVKNEICDTIEYAYSKIASDDCLVIDSANGDTFKVAFIDVYMIETVKGCHKIRIHYSNGIYECAGLLKDVMPKLDGRFRRCHRSYIVNLDSIKQVSEIVLNNGLEISYSLRYKLERVL